MAYVKTLWKNRLVEKPNTYRLQQNADGTVTQIPEPGQIIEAGTPVSADNLNKIENTLEAHDLDISKKANQSSVDSITKDYVRSPGYGATTGTANTYFVTLNPAPTAILEGMGLSIKINVTNTGASTIKVNDLGARTIKKADGNDVKAGDLKAGSIYSLRYSGAVFILQGEGGGYSTGDNIVPNNIKPNEIGDPSAVKTYNSSKQLYAWNIHPSDDLIAIYYDNSNKVLRLKEDGTVVWETSSFSTRPIMLEVDKYGDVYVIFGGNIIGNKLYKISGNTGQIIWEYTSTNLKADIGTLKLDSECNSYLLRYANGSGLEKVNKDGIFVSFYNPSYNSTQCFDLNYEQNELFVGGYTYFSRLYLNTMQQRKVMSFPDSTIVVNMSYNYLLKLLCLCYNNRIEVHNLESLTSVCTAYNGGFGALKMEHDNVGNLVYKVNQVSAVTKIKGDFANSITNFSIATAGSTFFIMKGPYIYVHTSANIVTKHNNMGAIRDYTILE